MREIEIMERYRLFARALRSAVREACETSLLMRGGACGGLGRFARFS